MGRLSDVNKKLRLQIREMEKDCKRVRFQCFKGILESKKKSIIKNFSMLKMWNDKSSYLTGLVSVVPVMRRRSRQEKADANFRTSSICVSSWYYMIKVELKQFKKLLKLHDKSPTDGRLKHKNRKHQLSNETQSCVFNNILSFKGRTSHYRLSKSKNVYLPQ